MCNAWNHSHDCCCGWGGDGHLGKRTDGVNFSNKFKIFELNRIDSYLFPNAKCPVCGASVYFYQAENGGRVFFDELGPPWPKHPCTDNSKFKYQNPNPAPQYFISKSTWQDSGWTPVTVKRLLKKSEHAFEIARVDNIFSKRIVIMIYNSDAEELKKSDIVFFAKQKDKTCFCLSAFDVKRDTTFEIEINHSEGLSDNFFKH